MSKSCHTTLFVLEWPQTFSPCATLWKWEAEKQETPYNPKYCHISVLLAVTFILQKQTPLQLQSFHTIVLYFSLMLCLLGAGRNLPPSYSGPVSARIGRESVRISCLPFCTWGRKWHLSLPLTGFHMAPSMCRGAWSELYSVPARRGVARAASFIDFLLLLQVGSHLRVFPSMTFYCERGIWALEWDRLVGQVSPVELLRIPVVKLFNTNNPLFTIYQKSIVVDRN